MSQHQKITGLIIKKIDLRETDAIFSLISPEKGLIRLKAKGIKKLSSKNAPHLQSLNFSKLEIVSGKTDLEIIISAHTLETFKNLRKDLLKISFAQLLLEHYLALVGEDINRKNFNYFLETLRFLDKIKKLDKNLMNLIYVWLIIKLLAISGRNPELHLCSKCRASLVEQRDFHFNPEFGGVICQKCRKDARMGFVINIYTVKLFRVLPNLEIQDLEKILHTDSFGKIYRTLNNYVKYYLDNPIKSEKFFNDLLLEI